MDQLTKQMQKWDVSMLIKLEKELWVRIGFLGWLFSKADFVVIRDFSAEMG